MVIPGDSETKYIRVNEYKRQRLVRTSEVVRLKLTPDNSGTKVYFSAFIAEPELHDSLRHSASQLRSPKSFQLSTILAAHIQKKEMQCRSEFWLARCDG